MHFKEKDFFFTRPNLIEVNYPLDEYVYNSQNTIPFWSKGSILFNGECGTLQHASTTTILRYTMLNKHIHLTSLSLECKQVPCQSNGAKGLQESLFTYPFVKVKELPVFGRASQLWLEKIPREHLVFFFRNLPFLQGIII